MEESHLETFKSGHSLSIDEYIKIFKILYEEHISYCKEWLSDVDDKFNLKRTCVSDIYDNDCGYKKEFYNYMSDFLKQSDIIQSKILDRLHKELGIFIIGRIKSPDSIIYKLDDKNRNNSGKFPINKCLNDLIGYRIIDCCYTSNLSDIEKHLAILNKKNCRIKNINRDLGEYKGYHIYFNGEDNTFFPLELQIWDAKHEQNNKESHKMYKQSYIKKIDTYNMI